MYGVHGLDDNALASPLGDATKSCNACASDADCGAAGNVCVRLGEGERVCAVECLHDKGCGASETCRQFGSATTGFLKGMACVPKTLSCGGAPPPPPAPRTFNAAGDLTREQTKTYVVNVGAEAKNIVVKLTGTGDADLYTRFGSAPTLASYECRPYKGGSAETCKHASATAATLQIMVNGYAASSHFELAVSWD
jgi:hypothetical protein